MRVKNHLQEKISHLFGKLLIVPALQCIQDFVGFFNEVSLKRGVGLLLIPRTTIGCAQAFLERNQLLEPLAG